MKVLVMGGTRFNGLALVQELHKHGHEVTILNRGVTEAPVPKGVRRLTADRNDAAALKAALGDEEWDCVQDISGYNLEQVRSLVECVKGRVGHYIFASSTVTYAATHILPIRETSAVDATPRQNDYARNKLECEAYLFTLHRSERFPATSVPFSMVFGPNNIIPDREQKMFQRLLLGRHHPRPRGWHDGWDDRPCGRRGAGVADDDGEPGHLREALQPDRQRRLHRRRLRRHLR